MASSANDEATTPGDTSPETPDKGSEPEVVFTPSEAMMEAVNQGDDRTPRTRRRASEAAELHQHQAKDEMYPGQPRIPQRDEGGPMPLILEETVTGTHAQEASHDRLRDASTKLRETAGVYLFIGKEETVHPILDRLTPGKNDFSGVTHPETLTALREAITAGFLRKA